VQRTAQKAVTTPKTDETLKRLLSLHPKLVDLSLERLQRLLAALGHPEQKLPPVVHVTGTNGKGSTLAFLRAICEAHGLKVHVYTSPHLVRFHERIRLAGTLVEENVLDEILRECEIANAGEPITFFEITTAAAFLAFSRTPADIVLLENGLGGRLDATNVIAQPALTGITPISMDHQQFLGETLAEIATEKAGIIKPGVACIVGPQLADAMDVITGHCDAKQAPLLEWGINWRAYEKDGAMVLEHHGDTLELPLPGLPGAHQIANAGQAAVMARTLTQFGMTTANIAEGLRTVSWPARLQRLLTGPIIDAVPAHWEVWLDGGHNPDAGETIARYVQTHWSDKPLYLIAGMINSKQPLGYFQPLAAWATSAHCITIPGEDAAIAAADLAEIADAAGLRAQTAESALGAANMIVAEAEPMEPARVLICGSLYLAGHILSDHQ